MTSFQEFLQKKAKEQDVPSRHEKRAEWIEAVRRLLVQIESWLGEADPQGLLDRIPLTFDRSERGLGSYKVEGLQIGVGDISVQVVPVACNVVASSRILVDGGRVAGRVDITNRISKYILWRVVKDGHESWEVLDEKFDPSPLDRDKLESILQDLLS
jgi:hypothetical protein